MQINQYANEAFSINDEDFYDVDFWTGTAFESRKISGLTLKTILSATAATLYTSDGVISGPRQVDLNGNVITFDGGSGDAVIQVLAANSAAFEFVNGTGQKRWSILKDTDGTGSNFVLQRYDNTGGFVENALTVDASTGAITFNQAYSFPTSDGLADQVLMTNGAGVISWVGLVDRNIYDIDGTLNANRKVITDDKNLTFGLDFGDIATGSGRVRNVMNDSAGQTTKTDLVMGEYRITFQDTNTGQSNLILLDANGTEIQAFDGTNLRTLSVTASGLVVNGTYLLPNVDGSLGQVLTTDGAGVLSWQNVPATVVSWGDIIGTLSDQTDLQTALNGKFDDPTGTTAQYIDGTGALQTFPAFLESDALISEVYNSTGSPLLKGTIVYINGGQGNLPTVTKAQADSDANSAQTFGWVRDDINNMSNGFVIVAGKLDNLNTNGLGTGTQLYLSPTTAGAYTVTKPSAPNHLVYVGIVVRDHPTQGVIEVKIQNGYELDELHDVQISSITDGQILVWDSSTNTWKNQDPSGPATIQELDPVINVLNTPPATPADGDRYRIGTSPTGAWSAQSNKIAQWDAGTSSWVYTTPVIDNTVYQTATATTFRYNGSAWVQWAGTPILQNGNQLGAIVSLGTRDNYDVRIVRNNLNKAVFGNTAFSYKPGIFTTGVLDFSLISPTFPALTATRTYQLPNKSGIVALVDDAKQEYVQFAVTDETSAITVGTSKITLRMPFAMTLTAVRASLSTAQASGSIFTVDVNLGGTSILGTKITIDNTEKTSVTAATPATIVTSALNDDGEITVDVDQIGNATAKGLKITLIGQRS